MNCTNGNNLEFCSCTYSACDKRGNCCQCVIYHNKRGELPGCFFSVEAEQSYDRSFENLQRDRSRLK
jgi:hypothetical protein